MIPPPDPEPRDAQRAQPDNPERARAKRRAAAMAALRGAVALARARLRSARGGRIGVGAAAVLTLGYAGMAIALRLGDGTTSLGGIPESAARGLAWVAAGPIALAAASDRAAVDRSDGVEALAAARGISRAALHDVRTLAAMIEVAWIIALPSAALCALSALLSGSLRLGAQHVALGAALALFGAVCGVSLGGLAAASGRIAGPRGRALFAGLILIPWGLAGGSSLSIPGALDAFLALAARSAGEIAS